MQPITIAHRGASSKAPENTLMAFDAAWRLGAEMIELDVRESVDGHLVCIHDPTIDRTANGSGAVEALTLKEIQEVDVGLAQRIPLLSEVLEFARGRINVNLDLKIIGAEERIVSLIREMNLVDNSLVSSFFHLSLSEIREFDDEVRTAVLFEKEIDDLASYAVELGAHAVNPMEGLVTEALISSAHESGLKVYPWTVNDEKNMIRLLNWGADGLITDHPDRSVLLIRSRFSQ